MWNRINREVSNWTICRRLISMICWMIYLISIRLSRLISGCSGWWMKSFINFIQSCLPSIKNWLRISKRRWWKFPIAFVINIRVWLTRMKIMPEMRSYSKGFIPVLLISVKHCFLFGCCLTRPVCLLIIKSCGNNWMNVCRHWTMLYGLKSLCWMRCGRRNLR